jgi:hypothetical protein
VRGREPIGYLENRRGFVPDYGRRQRAGLWIASTRLEEFNDRAVLERCKHRGISGSPQGVLALTVFGTAHLNAELGRWRQDGKLSERNPPEPIRRVA